MPAGNLPLRITDLRDKGIMGRAVVEFSPHSSSAGGTAMRASAELDGARTLEITGIQCRGGPGTLYRVRISIPHYRPFAFHQLILENRRNTSSDDVRLWVRPQSVRDIAAPVFERLPSRLRGWLNRADMQVEEGEDKDLRGLTGPALYDRLGPLRKACLLNLFTKMSDELTTSGSASLVTGLKICRQDRIFAAVDPAIHDFARNDSKFKSAPKTLHDTLDGYTLVDSFKSRDAHANLQITLMRRESDGSMAADLDIDESSGIEHGFEVIRNAALNKRTNPYLIREFLIAADLDALSLDPGYAFIL